VAPEIQNMLEKRWQDIAAPLPIQQLICKITHRIVGESPTYSITNIGRLTLFNIKFDHSSYSEKIMQT